MNVNENNVRQVEDAGINLKEFFITLWKQKFIIISITLIVTIITGIYSLFVLSPVYHSKLNIVINMPEIYQTKYGEYILPLTSNQQYIDLINSYDILADTIKDMGYDTSKMSIEDLKDRITMDSASVAIAAGAEQNSYEVKVAADNSEEAKELAKTLYDNYIEFVDVMTLEGAVNYYTNNFLVNLKSIELELESNKVILKKNEKLLMETPQTINQENAMEEIHEQVNTSEFIVLENIINSNYTKIENDIIINKQTINGIENSITIYNKYLDELKLIKNILTNDYETGKLEQMESDIVRITESNVFLSSSPIAPNYKTSPSNSRNVILGALLGGMIGVLTAFIKEYWFKKA